MGTIITVNDLTAAITSLSTAQIADSANVLAAATTAIEQYLNSAVVLATFDELHEPGRTRTIWLRNRPVQSLRISSGLTQVLSVANADAAVSRAEVAFDLSGDPPTQAATGVSLTSTASGVQTATDLTFAAYPTCGALATAIGAVSGWSATLAAGYSTYATADLLAEAGSKGAKSSAAAPLYGHASECQDYRLDAASGVVTLAGWPDGGFGDGWSSPWGVDGFRFPDRTWGVDTRFASLRCRYTAGYVTIPDPIKRACVMVAKAIYDLSPFGSFAMERIATVGSTTYTYEIARNATVIPPAAKALLSNYRRMRV